MEKKAARGLPTKLVALGPVRAMTSIEADFPGQDSSVVSYSDCPARSNTEGKGAGNIR